MMTRPLMISSIWRYVEDRFGGNFLLYYYSAEVGAGNLVIVT